MLPDIPLAEFVADPRTFVPDTEREIYFVCRLGNDSQIAADALRGIAKDSTVKDLVGGLRAWATDVDPNFPIY